MQMKLRSGEMDVGMEMDMNVENVMEMETEMDVGVDMNVENEIDMELELDVNMRNEMETEIDVEVDSNVELRGLIAQGVREALAEMGFDASRVIANGALGGANPPPSVEFDGDAFLCGFRIE